MLGDAIDDWADIALEMMEVEWRRDNNGAADAAWHFHNVHACLFEGGPSAVY